MKKAKNKKPILTMNRAVVAIMALAAVLTIAAGVVLLTHSGRRAIGVEACVNEVSVASGDTLSTLLTAQGVRWEDIGSIEKLLKSQADVSSLRADSDKIIFSRPADDAPVNKIVLVPGPWRQIELTCNDAGQWECKTIDIERDTHMVYRAGEIKDGDSFYVAGGRAGIPAGILADVYDLLAFEMDFERDVRAGQEFSVLYEENFSGGNKVDNGRVVAISFDALRGNVKMYRFKKADGSVGYYDESGNGAIKSLKRTPINNARVSSSYNMRRKHPVLGYTRAHRGVDFRAGAGTPIPAGGAGRVVKRAYQAGGAGNYIRIRHNASYETQYFHMSRFAKGINVGSTVRAGQIIGYVGSTGVSTGPHLHYEIIKDGKHVNPLTVKLPAIDNLPAAQKDKFLHLRELTDTAINKLKDKPNMFVQM